MECKKKQKKPLQLSVTVSTMNSNSKQDVILLFT